MIVCAIRVFLHIVNYQSNNIVTIHCLPSQALVRYCPAGGGTFQTPPSNLCSVGRPGGAVALPSQGVSHGRDGKAKAFPDPCVIRCTPHSHRHCRSAECVLRRKKEPLAPPAFAARFPGCFLGLPEGSTACSPAGSPSSPTVIPGFSEVPLISRIPWVARWIP